jgi:hypothetical protein
MSQRAAMLTNEILTSQGLILAASIDDEQSESELADIKNKVRQLTRRINRNSEPQASIESDRFTIQYGLILFCRSNVQLLTCPK